MSSYKIKLLAAEKECIMLANKELVRLGSIFTYRCVATNIVFPIRPPMKAQLLTPITSLLFDVKSTWQLGVSV